MSEHIFPWRTCEFCGFRTTSTSTVDYCLGCKKDGLRPQHAISRSRLKREAIQRGETPDGAAIAEAVPRTAEAGRTHKPLRSVRDVFALSDEEWAVHPENESRSDCPHCDGVEGMHTKRNCPGQQRTSEASQPTKFAPSDDPKTTAQITAILALQKMQKECSNEADEAIVDKLVAAKTPAGKPMHPNEAEPEWSQIARKALERVDDQVAAVERPNEAVPTLFVCSCGHERRSHVDPDGEATDCEECLCVQYSPKHELECSNEARTPTECPSCHCLNLIDGRCIGCHYRVPTKVLADIWGPGDIERATQIAEEMGFDPDDDDNDETDQANITCIARAIAQIRAELVPRSDKALPISGVTDTLQGIIDSFEEAEDAKDFAEWAVAQAKSALEMLKR